ncbi:uncharacterized protein LOC100197105 [Hydra vulgaris]|uniref:Uncharacterized protein LOC100197105 n=1 Tax=Hydra vulgaris TaxID=6087 RepID=A0ABM4C6Y8_HYDVU
MAFSCNVFLMVRGTFKPQLIQRRLCITQKLPLPPFTDETAIEKVRLAENLWNSKNPVLVSMGYTNDCNWRNRSEFIKGRGAIQLFLQTKWSKEIDYKLIKELWCYKDNRISVKFQYEYSNIYGQWFRAYGNENWEFNENGLMTKREASINDLPIEYHERLFLWKNAGPRPLDYPGLTQLGL